MSHALQIKELAGAPAGDRINRSRRILVVDDDADIRLIAAAVLNCCGYQTETAGDGAAAWDALQLGHYDLLITDHNMPKVSGFELIKLVRDAHMALPVILASGTLPEAEWSRQTWPQLMATLPKPFTNDELLGTVSRVLRATDDVREQMRPLAV